MIEASLFWSTFPWFCADWARLNGHKVTCLEYLDHEGGELCNHSLFKVVTSPFEGGTGIIPGHRVYGGGILTMGILVDHR